MQGNRFRRFSFKTEMQREIEEKLKEKRSLMVTNILKFYAEYPEGPSSISIEFVEKFQKLESLEKRMR